MGLLLLGAVYLQLITQSFTTDLPLILRYENDFPSGVFHPLKLQKRDVNDPDDPENWHIPKEYEIEKNNYIYYISNISHGDKALKEHFVDVDELLKKPGVTGKSSHPLLSSSYRRAVGARLSFQFPFYGHLMNNLTIATGGFIYIGDQRHNWLAATQYIAPLMANFDTRFNGSNVIYVDNGEMFVVEWRKLQLSEQYQDEHFTFQVILHKNGDIVFAYKDVPVNVSNISNSSHPVKLGISDAFLYNHVPKESDNIQTTPKRVIYEYHRIEIQAQNISSNTIVYLKAQPTCIGLLTCDECANSSLQYFNCSWCRISKSEGGSFCTDEGGRHRRRQSFVEGNCRDQSKHIYCRQSDDTEGQLDDVVTLPEIGREHSTIAKNTTGGGYAFLIFIFGLSLCGVAWLAYAYYNPHTTSGQMLIKYRPSRWSVPHSHVRYSASVHM